MQSVLSNKLCRQINCIVRQICFKISKKNKNYKITLATKLESNIG